MVLEDEPAWAVVNENSWGVYRARYDEELVGRLYRSLDQLGDPERLSLVADTWAATVAGLVPLERSLSSGPCWRTNRTPMSGGRCPAVSGSSSSSPRASGAGFAATPGEAPGRRHLPRSGMGTGKAAGEGAGESPRRPRLRARLVTLLGVLGADAEVGSRARQLLAAADAGGRALGARPGHGGGPGGGGGRDREGWEVLYSHYRHAATPQDEVRYLHALAGFRRRRLVQRTLGPGLLGRSPLPGRTLLDWPGPGPPGRLLAAWEAIEQHWDEMLLRWPPNTMHRVLEQLPALVAAGDDAVQRASAWLDSHPVTRASSRCASPGNACRSTRPSKPASPAICWRRSPPRAPGAP